MAAMLSGRERSRVFDANVGDLTTNSGHGLVNGEFLALCSCLYVRVSEISTRNSEFCSFEESCFWNSAFKPSIFTTDVGSVLDLGIVMLSGLEEIALAASWLSFIKDMKMEPKTLLEL